MNWGIDSSKLIPEQPVRNQMLNLLLEVNGFLNCIEVYWWPTQDIPTHNSHPARNSFQCYENHFEFGTLDIDSYHKQLATTASVPPRLPLSFELWVTQIPDIMKLALFLNPYVKTHLIIDEIDGFIKEYNNAANNSIPKSYTVISWVSVVEGNSIAYRIDTGMARVMFFKDLLRKLSSMNTFERVLVE
ncbi:MAG: hypothetical protein ACK5NK_02885 [Niabella sp.]